MQSLMFTGTLLWAFRFFPFVSGMEIATWDNKGCRSLPSVYTDLLGPSHGCQTRGQDRGKPERDPKEVAVSGYGVEDNEEDESQFTVYFSGESCEPNTMINVSDSGCSTDLGGKIDDYRSWEIWDMCNGTVGCSLDDES